MIAFSDNEKSAWLNGVQKKLSLIWDDGTETTGDGIVSESLKIEQTLCSATQLTFGLCSSASFSVGILNDNRDHVGMGVTVYLTSGDGTSTVCLGKYRIEKDAVSDNRTTRTLTGYDALYSVMNTNYASWYTELDFPMSLKQFRDAFFSYVKIEQVPASSLPNDGMTVEQTIKTDSLSGGDIIKAICEVNGMFGTLSSDGRFKYVTLDGPSYLFPRDDLYPNDNLYPNGVSSAEYIGGTPDEEVLQGSFVYQDYLVEEITGARLRQDGDDEGILYGERDNVYTISNNFLLFGKGAEDLTAAAANFLTYARGIRYCPGKMKARFRPWLELGDYVYASVNGASAEFPILQRTITGITGIYDEYKADGTSRYVDNANSITYSLQTVKSRTLRLVQNVDEVSSKLTAVDSVVGNLSSEIKQTVSSISLTVQNNDDTAGITISFVKSDGTEGKLQGLIEMKGLVTFVDLAGEGTTTINGSNIKTGTILADLIKAGRLQSKDGGNYWDFNTDEFNLLSTTKIGGMTAAQIAADAVGAQTQKDIFDKLTNNGAVQGIVMTQDGQLYINASYINSGVLSANLIKAGKLSDKTGSNYWNLDTGDFQLADVPKQSDTIKEVDVEYAISTSAITAPTTGWQTDPPKWEAGKYIWTRTKTVDGDNNTSYSSPVCIQGAAATAYDVSVNQSTITKNQNGTYSVSTITVSGKARVVSGETTAYSGRFIIYTSTDGTNFTAKYTSSSNESSHTYTIPAGIKALRFNLYAAGGTTNLLDSQTVPILDAGVDGKDAYTVILTNEAHTFAGTNTAAIAASATCRVIAFKGATQVVATIGTITGKPTGMTTTLSNNGTTSASFSVAVTTSMTTKSGVLTVPVTVDGKSFTKNFTYSLALKGDTGADGDDGTGIDEIIEEYFLSPSNTSAPSATAIGWSTTQPAWSEGKYIWTRSRVKWDDGTTTYTDPVLAKAINGANESAKAANDSVSALDAALNAEGVFNRLTNNGTVQGIYRSDGLVYINASYIATGVLADAGSNTQFNLSDGSLTMKKGSINIGNNVFQVSTTGALTATSASITGSVSASNTNGKVVLGNGGIKFFDTNGKQTVSMSRSSTRVTVVGTGTLDDSFEINEDSPGLLFWRNIGNPSQGYFMLNNGFNPFGVTENNVIMSHTRMSGDAALYFGTYNNGAHLYGVRNDDGSCAIITDADYESCLGDAVVIGNFTCSGTKKRVVTTADYGDRMLYCYESPTPYFGDIGEGETDETGVCYVWLDDVFSETIDGKCRYQAFLQPYGDGRVYISERQPAYFIVEGTPNLSFGWEIKAPQNGYTQYRLNDEAIDSQAYISHAGTLSENYVLNHVNEAFTVGQADDVTSMTGAENICNSLLDELFAA